MKFNLGQVVATPSALTTLASVGLTPNEFIQRHHNGDWGDLGQEDKQANDEALLEGERIFSTYKTPAGKIWVITEWDRSVTTVLLPSDY